MQMEVQDVVSSHISFWRRARQAPLSQRKRGEESKVLRESFLAPGLSLNGVVRLLSLSFTGIYPR